MCFKTSFSWHKIHRGNERRCQCLVTLLTFDWVYVQCWIAYIQTGFLPFSRSWVEHTNAIHVFSSTIFIFEFFSRPAGWSDVFLSKSKTKNLTTLYPSFFCVPFRPRDMTYILSSIVNISLILCWIESRIDESVWPCCPVKSLWILLWTSGLWTYSKWLVHLTLSFSFTFT